MEWLKPKLTWGPGKEVVILTCSKDPAIDGDEEYRQRVFAGLIPLDQVKVVPGGQLSAFVFRAITKDEWDNLQISTYGRDLTEMGKLMFMCRESFLSHIRYIKQGDEKITDRDVFKNLDLDIMYELGHKLLNTCTKVPDPL